MSDAWQDALLAARLFAADPIGMGGVIVRAGAGPVRDAWLACLADRLPDPPRRMPASIGEDRLLGGIDLSATLAAGRPIAQRGLLSESDGGVIVAAMAERLSGATAALIVATIDAGAVRLERDGLARDLPARFGLVLLDEGEGEDQVSPALADRVAFIVDLRALSVHDIAAPPGTAPEPVDGADAQPIETLCAIADAFGVSSARATIFALRVARAIAGAGPIGADDLIAAARLVLAPRATRLPQAPAEAEAEPEREQAEQAQGEGDLSALTDVVLEAARAAIPPDLLARLEQGGISRRSASGSGGGERRRSPSHGRRSGVRAGRPQNGARLDLVETLKAAAPWQAIRRLEGKSRAQNPPSPSEVEGRSSSPSTALGKDGAGLIRVRPDANNGAGLIRVRPDDFRIRRFVKRAEATTIFAVDASGSAAIARLAETKGAIELLLAEAYVRRAQVALIAFRGNDAAVLLPPTRALARARRSLGDLAGGGGTPLAAAIQAAQAMAEGERRKGRTPLVVLLTDGRANVARAGGAGAREDALAAATHFRAEAIPGVFLDTAQRPRPEGAALAAAMGARYVALPRVEAGAVADIVRALDG